MFMPAASPRAGLFFVKMRKMVAVGGAVCYNKNKLKLMVNTNEN